MGPKAISVALMRSIKHGVLAVALAFPMLVSAQVPQSGRIEGIGEEPLNSSAFDCRRCSFVEKDRAKPFVWLPQ